ncbi:MAG TPA: hypothetical protein VIZ65_03300 [Cellvibrionaceae bacterium]
MTVYFYSSMKQAVLYLLLACLPVVGLVCFYQALNMWELSYWAWMAFWGLISALFLGLFFLGLRWRIFIHTRIELTHEGLILHQGAVAKVHSWQQIGAVKSWPLLQLLILFDAKGQVVLPVDHMLNGFEEFKRAVDQYLNNRLTEQESQS